MVKTLAQINIFFSKKEFKTGNCCSKKCAKMSRDTLVKSLPPLVLFGDTIAFATPAPPRMSRIL